MYDPRNEENKDKETMSSDVNSEWTQENTKSFDETTEKTQQSFAEQTEKNEQTQESAKTEAHDVIEQKMQENTEASADPSFEDATENASDVSEPKTAAEGPRVREYHYEEKVKKGGKHKKLWLNLTKFVAACVIVSLCGGTGIGVGYGLVQKYTGTAEEQDEGGIVKQAIATDSSESLTASEIVKKVKPSVVSISTTMTGTTSYFGAFSIPYEMSGAGSGVIFYSDSDKVAIVTNYHVIEDAETIYVTFDDSVNVPAQVVGTQSDSDLAVLIVSWSDLNEAGIDSVSVATFGDSDALEVGDAVIAIGNAMGMGLSATDGIISAKNQSISVDGKTLSVIQTSAAINSGNSGGALVNSRGEVIGINTAKYNSSMVEGMGYAIPSNVISPIMESLLTDGTAPAPYIGIRGTSITSEDAGLYRLPVGALIVEVTENGPAAQAGMEAGDIITEYNGNSVMDMETLISLVEETEVGETVTVHVIRNGSEGIDLQVTIQDRNALN